MHTRATAHTHTNYLCPPALVESCLCEILLRGGLALERFSMWATVGGALFYWSVGSMGGMVEVWVSVNFFRFFNHAAESEA